MSDTAQKPARASVHKEDRRIVRAFAYARTIRLAGGPDEVHRNAIARMELAAYL